MGAVDKGLFGVWVSYKMFFFYSICIMSHPYIGFGGGCGAASKTVNSGGGC